MTKVCTIGFLDNLQHQSDERHTHTWQTETSTFHCIHINSNFITFIPVPDGKDARIKVSQISMWRRSVRLMSNWRQSDGLCCLGFYELFPRLFKLTWFFNSKYHMAKHIYNTGLEFNCQCNGVHPKLRAKLQLMAVTSQIIIPCTGSFIGCISALVHLMAWHWIGNRS